MHFSFILIFYILKIIKIKEDIKMKEIVYPIIISLGIFASIPTSIYLYYLSSQETLAECKTAEQEILLLSKKFKKSPIPSIQIMEDLLVQSNIAADSCNLTDEEKDTINEKNKKIEEALEKLKKSLRR